MKPIDLIVILFLAGCVLLVLGVILTHDTVEKASEKPRPIMYYSLIASILIVMITVMGCWTKRAPLIKDTGRQFKNLEIALKEKL